ncbi:chaperonin 10-like protein [Crucibulum laeve]|uniref:Chaperonin 10-like protein n=1 Tax=Crucibulum laeve TaxID=68775 RepID=A0A5C3LVE2_9AGAR|nr:chaperonin 10-like protein [Crucibulum laeve]
MAIPSTQKALLLKEKFGELVVDERPVPQPGPEQILVKIKSTALNPVDWKIQKYGVFIEKFPAVLGSDIAGDVVAIGSDVKEWVTGDKVFFQGTYREGNDYTSFQQYVLGVPSLAAKIPSGSSYDEAAAIPVALACAYVGLYHHNPYGLGIEAPHKDAQANYAGTPIVVLGGSSSVGQLVIQLAKLSGFSPIIATASTKHIDVLKSLGATDIIDRQIPVSSLSDEVKKVTDKAIKIVFDAVAVPDTQKAGFDLLAPGGQIAIVQQPSVESTDDKTVIRVFGSPSAEHTIPLLTGLYGAITQWLEDGFIKPNKVEVLPGGLAGIIGGLKRLERGDVSGEKLVARPHET